MKFSKAESNQNFPEGHWVSENNVWEIGFRSVSFGVQLIVGRVGNGWLTLNYCEESGSPLCS